jgi:hypothetical protein
MLKTILLLTPVYVTLFWTVVLHTDKANNSIPRSFLAKFMLAAFIVYLSHFLFYSGLQDIYIVIDPVYQLASLLVYPLYHIYFRLLTSTKSSASKNTGIFWLHHSFVSCCMLQELL